MMMKCRLLCALLVLALCCCSSVWVADAEAAEGLNNTDVSVAGPPSISPSTATGQSGSSGTGSAPDKGNNAPGTTGDPRLTADQTNEKAKDHAETTTTTTTTKPPTTTTTTTTQAPITTTTEAPAVSTTRAPSRLREMDGSLSSSARVCAPLVLAAFALAYTTVG
ncbi:mucin TcMUCII, putative [Trypanosoma cruzi]|uniref:Mucin TcMUCII, putative n=2 Tax=Trypanosoma cruzi TaxID=5693 RepID=Q4CRQ7_TRYCC|nr:mucin TcMUCII, putative [Trypanosoma cruzi]EAN82960.1 mucin TcMUCII, putative [Trypanosoma cruzi]|eukprot:XP_804811.1 mucin TcMUCII [Trypanosoma cruzi strain CL Brener]